MKLPKQVPQPEVGVYKGKKKDEFVMVALRPIELAILKFANGKWTTPQGTSHRTHKEAMRHVLYSAGDEYKDLLATLLPDSGISDDAPARPARKIIGKAPTATAEPAEPALKFENKKEVLEFLLNQKDVVDMLMSKLDNATTATPVSKGKQPKLKQLSNSNR